MTQASADHIPVYDCQPAVDTMCKDVLRGLAKCPKMLPSQYLYDERGARLFERICETEEYYPTRTEIAILRENMDAIVEHIGSGAVVIEPGSGSGVKTQLLLENLEDPAAYVPIDIAKQQLSEFAAQMDPDEFTRWIFPRLFHSRIPRYEAIANEHGYTVSSEEVSQVRDEQDFIDLVSTAISRSDKG